MSGPAREFLGAADHRRKPMLAIVGMRVGARLQAVQHIDARLRPRRQRRAHPRALAQLRDEEMAAARGVQGGGGGLDANSIRVGLDHRGDCAGAPRAASAAIVGKRGEIDGEDAGRLRRRRVGLRCTGSAPRGRG